MDNLYDNLENYEDENIVDELKKENSELKCKLEEYADRMDKLQKDFDKLSSEFKKLEMNYSSLLKTAKEEIKRKTLTITKLNTEKDMMVLNAIHNQNVPGLRRSRWQRSDSSPFGKDGSKDPDPDKVQSKEIVTAKPKIADERKHSSHISSEERISNSTKDITKSGSRLGDRPNSNSSGAKENIVEDAQASKPKALSIRNRRKSMPAIRSEAKFSTDEEGEYCYPATDANYEKNHDIKPYTYTYKTHYDKNRLLDDRYRLSETSSMEDRYSGYQEHNKDYKNRNNRQYDSDRYRKRDKYDIQKNKRHYSPERHRRLTRNYLDEQHFRQENNRMRVLKSPPPDRYHQYQRRNREGRNRYDQEEYHDNAKNRDRYQESYRGKHKLQNDNEEQCSKRRRNNSHNHYPEEDNRDGDGYPLPNCVPGEDLHHEYCQSPDYMVPEAGSTQPITEIMHTAVTQLEDPRLLSKRYMLYKGDKDMLSTVTGRNVDLKIIDTSNWHFNMEHQHVHVDIPKALTRRPSQCSEDIVRNIYMEIDNPVSNMSVESGEIVSLDDVIKAQDEVFHQSKQHKDSQVLHISTISEKQTLKNTSELKYKIPKIQKTNDNNQAKVKNKSNNDDKHLKTHSETSRMEIRNTHPNNKEQEPSTLTENMQEGTKFHFFSHNSKLKESNDLSSVKEIPSLLLDQYKFNDSKTTKQVSVESVLELSDETSDNVDVQKKFSISKSNSESVTLTNVTPTNVTVNIDVTRNTLEPRLEINTGAAINDDTKEPKSKRKSEKTTTKELAKCEQTKTVKEKRNRPKKDKKDTKEIKTKFTELFGDTTSSLITPEDLGITPASAQDQPLAKYIPICEDAQDAVELLITETKNKQTDLPNLKPYVTNNLSGEVNIAIETENTVVSQIKDKINDCNKQRKTMKKEVEKSVSPNVETVCETPIGLPVLTEDLTKPLPTLTEENSVLENNKPVILEEVVSTREIRNVLLYKPAILKAVATSTPQKDSKDIPVSVVASSLPDINCSENSKPDIIVHVANSTAAEQSFNNDTLDSQTDTDAPDVRIFVKRRRKIVKKAKPS